jgi:hypothetical protein
MRGNSVKQVPAGLLDIAPLFYFYFLDIIQYNHYINYRCLKQPKTKGNGMFDYRDNDDSFFRT